MKKIFLSALLFVMLISMSVEKAKAQCLNGGTLYTVTYHPSSDCSVILEYCMYYDAATNTFVFDLVSMKIPHSDISDPCFGYTITSAELNHMKDKIFDNYFSTHTSGIPPCPDNSTKFSSFRTANCWQLVNDEANARFVYTRCEGTNYNCIDSFTICFDSVSGKVERTFVSTTPQTGYGTCPTTPLQPWEATSTLSSCFSWGCTAYTYVP